MNVHAVFRNAAMLAGIGIALQSFEALLVPVWAVITLMAALPAVVFLSALVCPRALAATIAIVSICSGHARKRLTAMFADEGSFGANVEAALLGRPFTRTGPRTEARKRVGVPPRRIGNREAEPTKSTNERNTFGCPALGNAHALPRAIGTLMRRNIRKCLAANWTGIHKMRLAPFPSSADMGTLARATQFVRSVLMDSDSKSFVTDGADAFFLLEGHSPAYVSVTAHDRAEALFSRVGETLIADGTNRGKHCCTSDSVHREKNRGALLGKNACQQVMTLLKPCLKYIMKHRICQGGLYACC